MLDFITRYQMGQLLTTNTSYFSSHRYYETSIFSIFTESEETMLQHLRHDEIFGYHPSPAEEPGVTQAQHARLAQIELPIGQEPPEDGVKQGELENWEF